MDLIQYPKRPRFFALRFCRLITKVCLANQIGPSAFTLLTIIVHTEDAAGYRHAITFFNGQLAPLIGASSVDTLVRARRKAVEAGWLHYEEGGKGVAGRYWVVIPTRYEHVDDAPTCEMDGEYTGDLLPRKSEDKPKGSRREAEGKPRANAVDIDSVLIEDFPVPIPAPTEPDGTNPVAILANEFAHAYKGSHMPSNNSRHVREQFDEWIQGGTVSLEVLSAAVRKRRDHTEPVFEFRKRFIHSGNSKPSVAEEALGNAAEFLRRRGSL